MRFAGNINSLTGLSGSGAGSLNKEQQKLKELFNTPYPTPTGARPPDALIFSDPYKYLRICLNQSDYDGVARWYATRISEILKKSTRPPDFWDLSKLNVQDYCDRTLNLRDLRAFTDKCIIKMCIADLGNKVGFGWGSTFGNNLNSVIFLNSSLSDSNGQLDWFKSFDNCKNGTRYGMCIGWVKEPSKHTASRIITAIGAAFIGAAAFSALTAPASAASGASGGAAAGSSAGAGAGATAGSVASAAVPAGIEVVTVTAAAGTSVVGATVAAGLSAGAVAVAAAPPPLKAPQPVSPNSVAAQPAPPPPVIETVTVTAPAVTTPAVTVGQAITAGAVATAAAAPALLSPSIETVTVEAARVEQHPLKPAEAAALGISTIGISYPNIDVSPPNPQYDEDSLLDKVKENLRDAVEEYGSDIVGEKLKDWLTSELGREPTPTEYERYEDIVYPDTPRAMLRKYLPFILLAFVIAALVARK